jgi:hypothetical protein
MHYHHGGLALSLLYTQKVLRQVIISRGLALTSALHMEGFKTSIITRDWRRVLRTQKVFRQVMISRRLALGYAFYREGFKTSIITREFALSSALHTEGFRQALSPEDWH